MSSPSAPVLDAKVQAFLDQLEAKGSPPIYTLSYAEARKVLENAQTLPVQKVPVERRDEVLPVGPTGSVAVTIYRTNKIASLVPAVIYFHGGGWVLGSRSTHDRLLSELAFVTNAAYVFVNYTPSPEARFPQPLEEAYAVTDYVFKHGKELGFEPTRIAVAGDSVGGNMATAVCQLAKQRGGPGILYQALFYPVTDARMNTDSYAEFAEGPWLTRKAMEWFWDAYAPDRAARETITASPLLATQAELSGLPPALVITDENDVLRDEGEAYARALLQAGVDVTAVRYLGTIHDFMLLNVLSGTPATRAAIALAAAKLREAFGIEPDINGKNATFKGW